MKHEPMSAFEAAMREALWKAGQPKPSRLPGGLSLVPDATWEQEDSARRRRALRSSTMLDEQHQADPIFTPIFAAAFGGAGFTIFGTFVTYASVATFIATTAVTIGLQMLLMKPPKPDKTRQPIVQAVPFRFYGVGEVRVAGAFVLWEGYGKQLVSVQAIMGHRINAFKQFYLHDDAVTLTGNIVDTIMPWHHYQNGFVRIYSRLGAVPETPISEIASILSNPDIWGPDHRGDGQAYLGMWCHYGKQKDFATTYPHGRPILSAIAELALCWDFRDPDQDPDDPSTWQFTRNPVLHLAWHECFNEFGSKRDFRTAILPVLDMWQEEADVCDEPIARAGGGTEPRYQCDGQSTTELDPKVFTNAVLASMDGWMCDRGDGALLIVAGKFREKYVATLTDADIVGCEIDYDVLPEDEINRLIPRFNYPATGYVETDTDPFVDEAAVLAAGRPLARNGEYEFVTEWRQARRLGKRDFARVREKIRGQIYVRLSGINAVYAPWVRLETPKRYPRLNGMLFSNRRSVLNLMKGGFTMDVIKMPADIDAWNPAEDEGNAPPIPPKPSGTTQVAPTIDGIFAKVSGSSVYLQIFLVDPNDSLTPIIYWRVKDTGGGDPGAWVTQEFPDSEPSGGLVEVATGAVPADTILQVQAAWRSGQAVWPRSTPIEEVSTTIDTVAPLSLTTFAVTGGTLHLGHAPLSFTTKNDAHLSSIAVYRAPKGVPLNTAAHFAYRLFGVARNATFPDVDGDNTVTNLLLTHDFAADTNWTKGAGYTISGGKAHAAAGSASNLTQFVALAVGTVFRNSFTLSSVTGGTIAGRFFAGTTTTPIAPTGTNGVKLGSAAAQTGNDRFSLNKDASFAGDIDDVYLFAETADCAPQGDWDYYAIPENASGVPGPTSGPVNIIIV